MERKKKKVIYNVVDSLLLIAALVWVCSHFVHLGSVAYTDNAQVKSTHRPRQQPRAGIYQEDIFR